MKPKITEAVKKIVSILLLMSLWGSKAVRSDTSVNDLKDSAEAAYSELEEPSSLLSLNGIYAFLASVVNYKPEKAAEENVQDDSSPTVKKMLQAALEPVGNTLYVYGGGWNEEDTGAGREALSYGVSGEWKEFFDANGRSYNYKNNMYKVHKGLDCTGYVGYTLYQVFGDDYSQNGYVFGSKVLASKLQGIFGGDIISPENITGREAGDIMSKKGHAFIVIGECDDGSVVFLHASPPNVTLGGTPSKSGNENSEAYILAHKYMEKLAPEAHRRYENCKRGKGYLFEYSLFRIDETVLSDPDGYRNMKPEEILADLIP